MLHIHHLSSGAGTIGQLVVSVPSGLSLAPPQKEKRAEPLLHADFLLSLLIGPGYEGGKRRLTFAGLHGVLPQSVHS
jgi:hypothetical protein